MHETQTIHVVLVLPGVHLLIYLTIDISLLGLKNKLGLNIQLPKLAISLNCFTMG